MKKIRSLLIANRSEIAIRIMRAATELGIRTVAIYAFEDRFSEHRFKADESYLVGQGKKPVEAYLDIEAILGVAKEAGVDAIHPGYGFLSENPDFAARCAQEGTFDVAMRFLKEDPWRRLEQLRADIPNILFQMLLRGSNAVGYTNYPDNVVQYFVKRAAASGIDLFRVFDTFNWIDNMKVSIDAVLDAGALCEGTICYTGDVLDQRRGKYGIGYYVDLAKSLERTGVHILGIKDMAGVCRPDAADALIRALKSEVGLPIHFHTHDTSGAAAASVLAAIGAGVDAVDGAMDSMSGLTSQPALGAICAALEHSERAPAVPYHDLQPFCAYWESVRRNYQPFEPDMRAGTSDVYRHEMPGGQYTNLREQARSLGLDAQWPQVAQAYSDVNVLFGDIVKVTPSSKVVGDLALHLVANGLSTADLLDPTTEATVPHSVMSMLRGEMGYPSDGFPPALQQKILRGSQPIQGRAGAHIPLADLSAMRDDAERESGRSISDNELASYLMYPNVFKEFSAHQARYGDVSILPTPIFFYGLQVGQEVSVELEKGKTLYIALNARAQADEHGVVDMHFDVNGRPRPIRAAVRRADNVSPAVPIADQADPLQIGSPMQGSVIAVNVRPGQPIAKGHVVATIEAMKMETSVVADVGGTVKAVNVQPGDMVCARQLLVQLQ